MVTSDEEAFSFFILESQEEIKIQLQRMHTKETVDWSGLEREISNVRFCTAAL